MHLSEGQHVIHGFVFPIVCQVWTQNENSSLAPVFAPGSVTVSIFVVGMISNDVSERGLVTSMFFSNYTFSRRKRIFFKCFGGHMFFFVVALIFRFWTTGVSEPEWADLFALGVANNVITKNYENQNGH